MPLTLLAHAISVLTLIACTGDRGPAGSQGPAGPEGPADPVGPASSMAVGDLIKGIAATGPFVDEAVAVAAGCEATEVCVASPDVAMGLHYVNLDLIIDEVLDLARPEVLLYLPTESGLKLAGFEYLAPIGPPGSPVPDPAPPAPSLMGQSMNGPMEGHDAEMPPHYDLHVWAWETNPAGMFADFNAALSCPS